MGTKATTPKGKSRNGRGKAGQNPGLDRVTDYRFEKAKRKNNPPAKIAAEGTVPLLAKIPYSYSPRLSPKLQFDPTGAPDKLPELLMEARRRPLTADEAKQLAEALRTQEPWLEWAGKREKRGFEVDPVALHIHERVSPQAILRVAARQDVERSLFADPQQQYHEAVQFYRHEIPWTNRLILGDSLQVMTSLSRREDLAGKVQMIYMDPPYGVNFKSNFQSEVGSRDVKDKEQDLTREPEMVKAYRDTWHLGIHSYLSYLRDRLLVAKELLADSGSIFVQISDENAHRVRVVLDEVFGSENFFAQINWRTMTPLGQAGMPKVYDYLLWYARDKENMLFRPVYAPTEIDDDPEYTFIAAPGGAAQKLIKTEKAQFLDKSAIFKRSDLKSSGYTPSCMFDFEFQGVPCRPSGGKSWRTNPKGMQRLIAAERLFMLGKTPYYRQYHGDFRCKQIENSWHDTAAGFSDRKLYVVQTHEKVIQRCMLMVTKPGDLVLDPTCGSGTTAFVAEDWGRRWITIDTSRVAVALARHRLLTEIYPYFRLKGEQVSDGFEYKKEPSIELGKDVAQNTNLDPIFAKHQPILDKALQQCNAALKRVNDAIRQTLAAKLMRKQKDEGRKAITDADRRRWLLPDSGKTWEHWQVPFDTDPDWPKALADAVTEYRKAWRAKMDEVNACISANAEQEELVDQPEVVKGIVRVSGPFTVEAVQPPEMSLGDAQQVSAGEFDGAPPDMETFEVREVETRADLEAKNVDAYLDQMLRLLKMDGVRFPNNKEMRFTRLEPVMDGSIIHAEGRWANGDKDKDPEGKANVGVVFGPQYGPVTAMQVEEAIRQANRRGYDHLVIAGFSFDGASQAVISEAQHPRMKIHAANIRPDVNPGMAGLLKEQPGSQLFTVFGQPRTKVEGPNSDGEYVVTMEGVDIYNPVDNSITPTNASKVAAWFIDGDYDGRTFCITQAFFPDKDAWNKLSKALDGVVDPDRFAALSGTVSLPFPAGKHKSVAVKVIDPRGNEVMSVHKLNSRGARRG
ncbi:MAG: site-specific DNA-methyltransferase [Terriglobales bacterium]